MTITARIQIVTDGVARALKRRPSQPSPLHKAADGHASGHRHLGPPPTQQEPLAPDLEPPKDKPWVRTTHSDSQKRRFRR
jgi:hypothetical protein